MKKIVFTALVLTLLAFLLPLFLSGPEAGESEEEAPPVESGDWDELNRGGSLRVLLDGEVAELPLNEYIWGVVAAEMPASFEPEALKAQAVTARTYALRRVGIENQNHPGADLCGDYRCCQAYISPLRAAENWGGNAALYQEKIRSAVAATGTEVIYYEGKLIDAVFHSSSATTTLDAVEVWGNSLPYLRPVESPEGDEVPNFNSQIVLEAEEFQRVFLAAYPEAVLEGAPEDWFGEVYRSEAGSVRQLAVGGVLLRGTELRSLFGLRSTSFTVRCTQTQVIFEVTGYGHGVGMSQYGANAMAREGKSYLDILCWYYSGVEVREAGAES